MTTSANIVFVGLPSGYDFGSAAAAAHRALGPTALFYDVAADPRIYYCVNASGTAYNPIGGGTGGGTPASGISPKAAGTGAVGTATPYARQDHAHPINTSVDLGVFAVPLAWNASSNTPTLTDGVAPTNGINSYYVSVSGTTTLAGSSSWSAGGSGVPADSVNWNGVAWIKIAGSSIVGQFATLAALISAVPPAAANAGARALVGSGSILALYLSDGVSWNRNTVNAGTPLLISTGTTLNDGHDGVNLILSSTPALNLPTGRILGFGLGLKGTFTLAGGLTIGGGVTDLRATTGVAWASLVQTAVDGSTYDLLGTK